MSVIAWDGKSLAVDKQGTCGDMRLTVKKARMLKNDVVLAWAGDQEQGLVLARWYMDGADISEWPEFQKEEQWTQLIIADGNTICYYETEPEIQRVNDSFMAWGSGRELAMGALAMGANAEQAVNIAIKFNVHCGIGCDVFKLV